MAELDGAGLADIGAVDAVRGARVLGEDTSSAGDATAIGAIGKVRSVEIAVPAGR